MSLSSPQPPCFSKTPVSHRRQQLDCRLTTRASSATPTAAKTEPLNQRSCGPPTPRCYYRLRDGEIVYVAPRAGARRSTRRRSLRSSTARALDLPAAERQSAELADHQ